MLIFLVKLIIYSCHLCFLFPLLFVHIYIRLLQKEQGRHCEQLLSANEQQLVSGGMLLLSSANKQQMVQI